MYSVMLRATTAKNIQRSSGKTTINKSRWNTKSVHITRRKARKGKQKSEKQKTND